MQHFAKLVKLSKRSKILNFLFQFNTTTESSKHFVDDNLDLIPIGQPQNENQPEVQYVEHEQSFESPPEFANRHPEFYEPSSSFRKFRNFMLRSNTSRFQKNVEI